MAYTYAEANPGSGGPKFAVDLISTVQFPISKIAFGVEGVATPVSSADPLPFTISALRASNSPFTDGDPGVFILAKRRDEDTTLVADGDYAGLNMDEAGRLKVATQPGSIAAVTGSITANGQTLSINVERASNLTISMSTAALAGHNVSFEYSNNSTNGTDGNWYGVQVVRSNANTVETATGALAATPAYGWEASVNAYKWFRVRATAHTSGTASYILQPGSYATEPIPAGQVTGTQPISGSVTVAGATLAVPSIVADVASAALTTTTTTAAITPGAGLSYSVDIPVTAVTGTNPTLDVVVQESDDSGTNWFDVFHFPRIIATGTYRSPPLKLRGNRLRYVQTVGGTSPSFTRAVNRLQRQGEGDEYAQLIDRAISLTTLNAATTGLNVQGVKNVQVVLDLGAATTPPAIQLEGSEDNTKWYPLGAPLTGVANSTVSLAVNNVSPAFVRGRVSTVGAAVTPGYLLIKGF